MLEASNNALKNRLDVMLYMVSVNREVTCTELLDELVVELSVSKLNHLLKRLVATGFVTMRGTSRQTHYYTIKNEVVEQMQYSLQARNSNKVGSKAA